MKTRFSEVKYGIALVTEIETKAIKSTLDEARIFDACTWKTMEQSYPGFKLNESYQDWKDATLMGMEFALKIVGDEKPIEIQLLDINAHDCHSNLYSIFMAGVLAVFRELDVVIKEEGIEKIKEFARAYMKHTKSNSPYSAEMNMKEFRTKYL